MIGTRRARGPRWAPVLAASLLALGAGCSIRPDDAPRDVPSADRPAIDPAGVATGEATGSGRIFLVDSNPGVRRLHSVPREAATAAPLLEALVEGPNAPELDGGLVSALPDGMTVNSVRLSASTMTIDVSEDLLELNTTELRLAVAQLVFTACEVAGIRSVAIRVDGSPRELPNGRGVLSTAPLTVYDFPGIAASIQPDRPPIPSELVG